MYAPLVGAGGGGASSEGCTLELGRCGHPPFFVAFAFGLLCRFVCSPGFRPCRELAVAENEMRLLRFWRVFCGVRRLCGYCASRNFAEAPASSLVLHYTETYVSL